LRFLLNSSGNVKILFAQDLKNRKEKIAFLDRFFHKKEIVAIVRQLSDDGQIMIAGQGDSDAYV
jgi:flagellar motor switch protein FliG